MKTPEEIKKGLNHCCDLLDDGCGSCPYRNEENIAAECITRLAHDALAYIQQLESRLDQVERERDELLKERCSE